MSSETLQRSIHDIDEQIKSAEIERERIHARNQAALDSANQHIEAAKERDSSDPKATLELQSFSKEAEKYELKDKSDIHSYDAKLEELRSKRDQLVKQHAEAVADEETERKMQAAAVVAKRLADNADQ